LQRLILLETGETGGERERRLPYAPAGKPESNGVIAEELPKGSKKG
jgi:hypothetical protein